MGRGGYIISGRRGNNEQIGVVCVRIFGTVDIRPYDKCKVQETSPLTLSLSHSHISLYFSATSCFCPVPVMLTSVHHNISLRDELKSSGVNSLIRYKMVTRCVCACMFN